MKGLFTNSHLVNTFFNGGEKLINIKRLIIKIYLTLHKNL